MEKMLIVFFLYLSAICFGQKIATLEDGTRIILYPNKSWQLESEVVMAQKSQTHTSGFLVNRDEYSTVYADKLNQTQLVDFPKKNLEVIDYIDGNFLLRSDNGRLGYVSEYSVDNDADAKKNVLNKIIENAWKEGKSLQIRNIKIEEINSASGVDFSIEWIYTNPKKKIKYIYFTVVPYNEVGDIQTCDISGHASFTGKVTGPISTDSPHNETYWSTAWYNSTISLELLT